MSHSNVLIEWEEPTHSPLTLPSWLWLSLLGGALIALIIGISMRDSGMYVASATGVVVAASLAAQRRCIPHSQHIILTTESLSVGKTNYPLHSLVGFWLHCVQGVETVSIAQRNAFVEVSFSHALDREVVRDALLEVVAEIKAPKEHPILPSWVERLLHRLNLI